MENLDIFGGSGTPPEPKKSDDKGPHLTTIELKAIDWYASNNNCRLSMGTRPTVNFIDKATGEEIKETLADLVDQYRSWKKEDAKERARQRRADKAAAENGRDRRAY